MRRLTEMKYPKLLGALLCLAAACSRKDEPATRETTTPAAATAAVDTTTPDNLAGTRWRLVEIQGSGGAQPARPDDPAKYTIVFDSEGGLVRLQLDCNRASGSYDDKRSDARSGTLVITSLNSTQVACPPNSLAARVSRDMALVRSYQFDKGRLLLVADSGTYVWVRGS